jgi:hypothetical protein
VIERLSSGHGNALLDWALEQLHVACSDCGRGSGGGTMKSKVARILDDSRRGTCGDISPHTKRSFVE